MEATANTCGPECEGDGLACSFKHASAAAIYCEEGSVRDTDECRRRLGRAYGHLTHCSDIHLANAHPRLAKRAREIRKAMEPTIFGKTKSCPPREICGEILSFQQEVADAMAKFEGHAKQEVAVAQFVLVPEVGEDDSVVLLFAALLTGALATAFLRNP